MSFIAPIHTPGTDSSLQQQLYLPHFLTAPIDSSKFPETCVAPRAAQRGIEVSTTLDADTHPKVGTARQLQQAFSHSTACAPPELLPVCPCACAGPAQPGCHPPAQPGLFCDNVSVVHQPAGAACTPTRQQQDSKGDRVHSVWQQAAMAVVREAELLSSMLPQPNAAVADTFKGCTQTHSAAATVCSCCCALLCHAAHP